LIIFNRPINARLAFEAIRKARPTRLYVAADGPRHDKPGEAEKCEACREIVKEVDWNCEVHTLFRDKNLGCGKGPNTAISWFFEHETEGIILEDDCLPTESFFPYCAELLERYRNDTRIIEIAGTNLDEPRLREKKYSYSYSNLISSWGWATWRRAWKFQDFYMNQYTEINEKRYLDYYYATIYERDFFQYIFSRMYQGDEITNRKSIWDYQWQFACNINSGLVIVPAHNLIKNLGFGEDATNTIDPKSVGYNLTLGEMNFPMKHPEFVMVNRIREKRYFKLMHTSRSSRIKSSVKQIIPKAILEKLIKPLRHLFSFGRNQLSSNRELLQQEN